jgi:hypothetical protein
MCTKTIAENVSAGATGGAAAGSVVPIFGTPPKDIAGEERRRRARALQRTAAGRPGAGRAQTIFTGQTTGAGPTALKTKTGQ